MKNFKHRKGNGKVMPLDVILAQAREDPSSLLPPCRTAVCTMPIGCCKNEFGISKAVDYMKQAGLTRAQIIGAFQKVYGNKGIFKGKHLARVYLGGQ